MEWVIIWVVCAFIGYAIGKNKGRGTAGAVAGLLLGPIGIIVALVLQENREKSAEYAIAEGGMKKCPFCAELIKSEASVCRYCGKDV